MHYLKQAGIDSVALVASRIAQYGIACDLRWGFCELANTPAQFAAFKDEQDDLLALGYRPQTRLVSADQLHEIVASDQYAGGWWTWARATCTRSTWSSGEARAAHGLAYASSSRARCCASSTAPA